MGDVRITPAGDPFYAAGLRRTEDELVEAIREDERRQGRELTPREREAFAQAYFSEEYRAEVQRLMALGVTEDEDE